MTKEKYVMEVKEVKVMGDREIYTISSESKKGQKWFASYNRTTNEYVCSCPKYFLSDKEKCKHLNMLINHKNPVKIFEPIKEGE